MKRPTDAELVAIYRDVVSKASPTRASFGALLGAVPAMVGYRAMASLEVIYFVMLAGPPVVIGLGARVAGRTYKLRHRLAVGLIAAVAHVIGCVWIGLDLVLYPLAVVAGAIAFNTAKRGLSRDEDLAIDKVETKLIRLEDHPGSLI